MDPQITSTHPFPFLPEAAEGPEKIGSMNIGGQRYAFLLMMIHRKPSYDF
jgi:hypothetical protein